MSVLSETLLDSQRGLYALLKEKVTHHLWRSKTPKAIDSERSTFDKWPMMRKNTCMRPAKEYESIAFSCRKSCSPHSTASSTRFQGKYKHQTCQLGWEGRYAKVDVEVSRFGGGTQTRNTETYQDEGEWAPGQDRRTFRVVELRGRSSIKKG